MARRLNSGAASAFARAFRAEIAHLARSRWDQLLLFGITPLLLLTIGAMLFGGVIRGTPVAVVDQDHSPFSRAAIRAMEASRGIRVVASPTDLEAAQTLLRSGRIYSIAYIPAGAGRDALRRPDAVVIFYNGAFQTIGALAASAQSAAVTSAVEPLALARARDAGLPAARLKPPGIAITLIGNPQTSFELFLGGLIAPGVLHLLMGCAAVMAFGRELKGGSLAGWPGEAEGHVLAAILGKATPYILVFSLWGFAWIAWLCGWRGWAVEGSLPMLLAGMLALMAATAAISAFLVALTGDMDVSFSATAVYAGSAIAFSNGTLPLAHGPLFAQVWSQILPYSHYLRLQNAQMVMGADASASFTQLGVLLAVALAGFAAAAPLAVRRARRAPQMKTPIFPLPVDSFFGAFAASFRGIASTKAVASILLLAVVAYAFYYPLAYAGQTAVKLPVAVVDEDGSDLSRLLLRELSATRAVDAQTISASPREARRLLRNGDVDAVILIPPRFEARMLSGSPHAAAVYLNGAYLVRATSIGKALSAAVARAAEQRLAAVDSALHISERMPHVLERPLYNPTEGYGSYAVPAVSAIILQQTLLLGAALIAAIRRETAAPALQAAGFAGLWAALTLIGVAAGLFYFGFVFWFQDYPRLGNPAGLVLLVPLFAAAASALGLWLGSLFDRHERVMHILVGTSVPLFFLGGAAWPLFMMPGPLALAAHLSPATSAIQGFVKLNSAGATLSEIRAEWITLLLLTIIFGSAAWFRLRQPGRGAGQIGPHGVQEQSCA